VNRLAVREPETYAQTDDGKDDGRPAFFEEIKRRNLGTFREKSNERKKCRKE